MKQLAERDALAERVTRRTHYGCVYALTVIVAAQFMYINFHYILGATLTAIAVGGLVFQIAISSAAYHATWRHRELDDAGVRRLLAWHFVGNHLMLAAFLPFFVWAIVLMYQRIQSVQQVEIVA